MTQKWNLQDIRPANSRPVKSKPESTRPNSRPTRPETAPHFQADRSNEQLSNSPNKRRSYRQLLIVGGLILAIFATSFAVSVFTSGAEVTVYPKVRQMTMDADITAYPDQQAGELAYEILTLEATGERQVTASGQTDVQTQASGQITITKTTPGSERLIKNTRFATSDGLIFRIEESVVVPGAVGDSPGTIVADVFADEAGEEYNLASGIRFTVPGFQEGGFTELFNAIYAVNASDITGGYDGPQYTIDDTELADARQSLQAELRNSLVDRVEEERPADFKLFLDAIAITYRPLPAVEYGEDLVTIKEVATLQVPLFKQSDLATYIAAQTVVGYDAQPVRIDNLDDINFTYSQATTSEAQLSTLEAIDFNLSGQPKIVWTFDAEKMKLDLVGMERTALIAALTEYPGLEKGEAKIRPFWKQSFPKEINKITITEVLSTQ